MTITLDMEPILSQLQLIIQSNEADNAELVERMDALNGMVDALAGTIHAIASNNALLMMWNIGLMAFGTAMLLVVIFAIAWRK